MENWLKISLVWAWCCWVALAVIVEHRPVLEGSSTTLVCEGNASGDRSVYWKAARFDQTPSNLSTCTSVSKVCKENNTAKYHATIEVMGRETFNSSLTIRNVTSEDQYYIFECVVDNISERTHAWNFSKVFYGPDDLTCTGHYVKHSSEINITCLTSKVYPGFVCEFVQFYNQSDLTTVPSHDVYGHNFKSADKYTSAMCSIAVPVSKPGVYQYFITGYAGFSVNDRVAKNVKHDTTNEVNVSSSVVVEQQTTTRCPGPESPLLVWCTAYLVSSPATFLWSFNNGDKTEEIQKPANKSGNYYRSILELKDSESRDGMTVTCMVNFKANSRNKSLKDSISLKLPTIRRPYFTHSDETITANVFSLDNDATSSTFKCQLHDHKSPIQDGRSADISLNVSCHSKDEPDLITNTINNGHSVTFTIQHRNIKQGICKCYVYHRFIEPRCYNSTANFTFYSPSKEVVDNERPRLMYVIYYIVAGTIGIIMLIFVIGICLFLKSRWSELYTYMNIYFSFAETTDGRTLERDYEAVSSFFRGRPDSQYDWSRAREERSYCYHDDNAGSQGLIPPPGVHTSSDCISDINPRKYNSGCNNLLHSNAKKTIVQHKVQQFLMQEEHAVLNEDPPATIRLIRNRPPPIASDESSSFSSGHVLPPRPCVPKRKDGARPTNYPRMSSSSCSDVNRILDHDYQTTTCPETSESEAFCYKRNILPPLSFDPEQYFVPISSPRHKQVAQRLNSVNRSQDSQPIEPRLERSQANTPLTEDSQSIYTPMYYTVHTGLDMKPCGADYSNIATVSRRSSQTAYASDNSSIVSEYINTSLKCYTSRRQLEASRGLLATPDLYEIPFVLSDGPHRCRKRKKKRRRTQSGDYTNIYLEPHVSKSRSCSKRSTMFQKGNISRHRNTRREKKCAYENIQPILSGLGAHPETNSLDTDSP